MQIPTDVLFDYAPISLWEHDFSGVKRFLDDLRVQGVTDLRAYLAAHPEAVAEAMGRIEVLNVNRKTLELFGAASREELAANLSRIFRDEMRAHFADELVDIWNGQLSYEGEGINYTLNGDPIAVHLRWEVLPGAETTFSRVLVSLADIRERKRAERALAESEAHFRGLFDHAPIGLWEQDFSAIKRRLDGLRAEGVTDLAAHLQAHPEIVDECLAQIVMLDLNQETLELYGAGTKEELLSNLPLVFRDEMRRHFRDELLDIWNGRLVSEREGVNHTLQGDTLYIRLRWSVLPGCEQTFGRVLLSILDMTARKKAEDYLRYLGTHDVLTGLYNRAFFDEERTRLERGRRYPVSVMVADLDGLKPTNDTLGHEAGDKLLRRVAEVLRSAFRAEDVVARIGGDEFAALMPATDETAAAHTMERIQTLINLNNKYYRGPALSLSVGVAIAVRGLSLTEAQRLADDRMYAEKRTHHAAARR